MSDKKTDQPPIDIPIRSSDEDMLGRAEVAHDFAKSIQKLNASDGIVAGVLGSWGSGKSSFINLMREEFDAKPSLAVIDFNPWMFSGTQQLVDMFFKEIASELRIRDKTKFGEIADSIMEYSDVFSPASLIPVVGAYVDRSITALKTIHKWREEHGRTPLYQKVSSALLALEQPIVVVIDDIDRLETDEIRDIFKLVRLTANFPNVIYVLSFDRGRIEAALDQTNVPGRQYLEKIIQLSFDLPTMPTELMRSEVFKKLNIVLAGADDVRFNQSDWSHIYFGVIEPLISNLRDVTRLALSAQLAVETLGKEVETADILALEAVRVFRPELFEQIQELRSTLTGISEDAFRDSDNDERKKQVQNFIDAAGSDKEVVENLIRYVFPAAQKYTTNTHYGYDSQSDWKRNHKVAHIDYLNMYLDRVAPQSLLAFRRSEKAVGLMQEPNAFENYLDSLPPEELEGTISGLEAYEGEYDVSWVKDACIALMNRIHAIPDRPPTNIFDVMRPDIVVGRVVLRMLRAIPEGEERESVVNEVLPHIVSYSSQMDFIRLIGYDEGSGHKLVSKELWERLADEFFVRLAAQQSKVPKQEWGLLSVYTSLAKKQGDDFQPIALRSVDAVRSMFSSGMSTATSENSQGVTQEQRLWWDGLVQVFGTEDKIKKALARLRKIDGETDLVKLVAKYLEGWRPRR